MNTMKTHRAAAGRRGLALTKPRTIPGITDETIVYNTGTKNRDEYHKSGVAELFPTPTKEELIAHLNDTIEANMDGVWQAGWDIHCAVHLIKMLEGGVQ